MMVVMKNIETVDGNIRADCFVEDSETVDFTLFLDPRVKTILSNTRGCEDTYVAHAAYHLFKLCAESKEIPKETALVWY